MRVNNGLTPQELEAYGISDVHDIVYNPSYDVPYLFVKSSVALNLS